MGLTDKKSFKIGKDAFAFLSQLVGTDEPGAANETGVFTEQIEFQCLVPHRLHGTSVQHGTER